MKFSIPLLAGLISLAWAHEDHGQHVPKILGGRRFLAQLEAQGKGQTRALDAKRQQPRAKVSRPTRRQDASGRCGPEFGSCAAGQCCSAAGWCGQGREYCAAPDCQINYSTGCDAHQRPSGPDTAGVARPKVGNVPYGGAGIYSCINPGDVALTYDDGPYLYTNDLLDKFKAYGAKATFFVTGNNLGKGQINDPSTIYPAIIRRMHAEGHQIASHTWSHQNAAQLTNAQFTDQMIWNEIALNSILGFFPTYMRPPYSSCPSNCQNVLNNLGYHITYFDLDTEGYLHTDPSQIQVSKNIWNNAMSGANPNSNSFLQIEHDIHYQVVYNLTDHILSSLYSNGFRAVTVGECLGDPQSNWYRTGPSGSGSPTTTTASSTTVNPTRSTVTAPSPTATRVTTDATCGNGVTCAGSEWGSCCSVYGWCGSTDAYCALSRGCQPAWGTCDGGAAPNSLSTAISSSSTTTTPSSTMSTRSTALPSSSSSTTTPTTLRTTTATPSTILASSTTTATTSTAQPTQTQPADTLKVSTNGRCGASTRQTCRGSTFGNCCGSDGRCTSNLLMCLSILGCQANYGTCLF